MTNTKHTPGPWKFGAVSGHIFCAGETGYEGFHLATVRGTESEWADAREAAVANARLIAAAPDLLAALQGMMAASYRDDPITYVTARNLATAAISRATGAS